LCGTRADGQRHGEHSACTREGLIVAATQTDHIVPISWGGPMWDPNNHQALCASCGARKSQTEQQEARG